MGPPHMISPEHLGPVLDTLPVHVAVVNPEGEVVTANALWREMARDGGTLWPRVGESFPAASQASESEALVLSGLWMVLAGEADDFSCEHGDVARDKWFLFRVAPVLRDTGGAVVGQVDISAQRDREQELEAIVTMARALRLGLPKADMVHVMLSTVRDLLTADAALFLEATDDGAFRVSDAVGAWADAVGRDMPGGDSSESEGAAAPPSEASAIIGDLEAVAAVSLRIDDRMLGSLWVGQRTPITEEQRRLLRGVASIASSALDRANLVSTLEERVTERTRELGAAYERLKDLDRLKNKFIRDVSHELRTPVANLVLYLALLERGKEERKASYLTVLRQQAERLERIITNVLDLSGLDLGAAEPTFTLVDVNLVLEHVAAAHRGLAEAGELELRLDLAADLGNIKGDRNLVTRLFTNLVGNALLYTARGYVSISSRLSDSRERVEVFIEDTGMGFDQDDIEHAFERFYRGSRIGQSDIPGAGLGLAIAEEIATIHGGSIAVESRVGEGSRVTVSLPVGHSMPASSS